jgi:EAL domain-containing protein (putative c-di-GMP-specific phosphodiesterase class I)
VESLEQLEFLRESGCDEIQGFLLAGPITPEEFSQFMERKEQE